jgi:photosystem II stability/assembly factor-like uncharacterized protein
LLATLVTVGLVQAASVGGLGAQEADTSQEWELTPLTVPVRQLFTAAGAVFASTDQQLLRSDDAGVSWSPVALPGATTIAAVDPTDPRILYAAGGEGVYRTEDGAASWQLSLRYADEVGFDVSRLAVSAADHNQLYLGLSQAPGAAAAVRLLRSSDGGHTWQLLKASQAGLCAWNVQVIQPHPTAADRLFWAAACQAGRTFGATLERSTDAGASWVAVFNPEPYRTPALGYPTQLVGGQTGAPGRYYLATNRDARLGGSTLFRSDDDGTTWMDVLSFHGGGTPGYRSPEDPPDSTNTRIGGLAVAAADVARVYVGLRIYDQYPPQQPVGGGVLVSTDAGTTWTALGPQDLGGIDALALSSDGGHLYAATNYGIRRMGLLASEAS